jgi:hypothetical protein
MVVVRDGARHGAGARVVAEVGRRLGQDDPGVSFGASFVAAEDYDIAAWAQNLLVDRTRTSSTSAAGRRPGAAAARAGPGRPRTVAPLCASDDRETASIRVGQRAPARAPGWRRRRKGGGQAGSSPP